MLYQVRDDLSSYLPLVYLARSELNERQFKSVDRQLTQTLLPHQTMIIAGLFSSYLIDWGTHHFANSASWRVSPPAELEIRASPHFPSAHPE